MKQFFKQLIECFSMNGVDFRFEQYLSKSEDLADLEHRERKWMRMNESERNFHSTV